MGAACMSSTVANGVEDEKVQSVNQMPYNEQFGNAERYGEESQIQSMKSSLKKKKKQEIIHVPHRSQNKSQNKQDSQITQEAALARAAAGLKIDVSQLVQSDYSEVSSRPSSRPSSRVSSRSRSTEASTTVVHAPGHTNAAGARVESDLGPTIKIESDMSSMIKAEVDYLLKNLFVVDACVNTRERLNQYSILEKVPVSRKLRILEMAKQVEVLDRAMGSMCGMAVGDAMGHMFEFLPAQDEPGGSYFALRSMKFYGEQNTFGLQYGQWTDDASMGLCMADSLILHQGYDGSDMRARFWCWWYRGYNNAFRLDKSRRQCHSVGLGGNISKSLNAMSRLRRGEKPPPVFSAKGEDAGNGSLMRFTPIALFFHSVPLPFLYEFCRQSSYTTHPGIVAAEACSLLGHLIYKALRRPSGPVDAKQFLEESTAEYLRTSGLESKSGWGFNEMKWLATGKPERKTERCWEWRRENLDIAGTLRARGGTYNGYPVSSGYFGSYSLDGLAMALWAVYHTSSFDEAIAKSINLCGDADSHGSIAGQIAGALYGYSSIHPQFIKWQSRWDEHEFAARAVLLHELGSRWAADSDSCA
jgi:ADP-ribosyl-[dinitrogen reductase] hydrolase